MSSSARLPRLASGVALATSLALVLTAVLHPGRAPALGSLAVGVFARVPSPGQPEGLAVGPDGTVYVGTDVAPLYARPDGAPNSTVFKYSPTGTLERAYTIPDAAPGTNYGLFGLALDAEGTIYALEHNPPSVIAIDPATGSQRVYSAFRQVPRCLPGLRATDCKETLSDLNAFPNFAVFAPDGAMYVTDTTQALIWRVPKGGGRPEVWLTDPGLETVFGPNDAQLTADGHTLLFMLSTASFNGQRSPGLYAVPILPGGRPGPVREIWSAQGGDFPEGIAIARSGNLYVSAAGANQIVVLSPAGRELARVPMTSQQNSAQPVPFDEPATVAFLGHRLLTPNHAYTTYNPQHWAVLSVEAGEGGISNFHPRITSFARSPTAPRSPTARNPTSPVSCPGVRRLRIRLPRARHRRYIRAAVFASGRRIAVRRASRLRGVPVDLHGLPAGRVRIKVVATTARGRRVVLRRIFRICGPAKGSA
jgi:sugar lactone lactonase YvrE